MIEWWNENLLLMSMLLLDLLIFCLIGGLLFNLWETMLDFWNWVFWKLKPKKEKVDGELTIGCEEFEISYDLKKKE